jgi:hypothetical protein
METSTKWHVNLEDIQKWMSNSLLFIAPVAVIYLGFVAMNINNGGFAWSDFVPDNIIIGTMVLYVINIAIDFFKKLTQGPIA